MAAFGGGPLSDHLGASDFASIRRDMELVQNPLAAAIQGLGASTIDVEALGAFTNPASLYERSIAAQMEDLERTKLGLFGLGSSINSRTDQALIDQILGAPIGRSIASMMRDDVTAKITGKLTALASGFDEALFPGLGLASSRFDASLDSIRQQVLGGIGQGQSQFATLAAGLRVQETIDAFLRNDMPAKTGAMAEFDKIHQRVADSILGGFGPKDIGEMGQLTRLAKGIAGGLVDYWPEVAPAFARTELSVDELIDVETEVAPCPPLVALGRLLTSLLVKFNQNSGEEVGKIGFIRLIEIILILFAIGNIMSSMLAPPPPAATKAQLDELSSEVDGLRSSLSEMVDVLSAREARTASSAVLKISAPLRKEPDRGADRVDRLQSGQTVFVLERRGSWVQVAYQQAESGKLSVGWVSARNLRWPRPSED